MSIVDKYRQKLYRGLQVHLFHDSANLHSLDKCNHPFSSTLSSVLSNLHADNTGDDGTARIDCIEHERTQMNGCDDSLVDGSLGEGNDYEKNLTVRKACGASKQGKSALLMYHLVRALNPTNIIELGTCVGISTAYQAAALALNNQDGRITTLEASPYLVQLARNVHNRIGLNNVSYVQGYFADTLLSTLKDIGPVDFAYIDGHHQYQPTLDYYNTVLHHAKDTITIVFDDIRWSDGMKQAWAEIRGDKRFSLVVDLHSMGVCIHTRDHVPGRFVSQEMYSVLK